MRFENLKKRKQRVLVALDVIKHLNTEKFQAEAGAYIDNVSLKDGTNGGNRDIKKTLKKVEACSVCAMGACILSVAGYKNTLNWDDVGGQTSELNYDKIRNILTMFKPKQLLMIETAFEDYHSGADRIARQVFEYEEDLTADELEACRQFYRAHDNDRDRLMEIMKNIVRNEGKFKP